MNLQFKPECSILLSGELSYDSIPSCFAEVARLDQKKTASGIRVYLNSPGGNSSSGLALYDLLQSTRNDITVIGTGECSSIAALVLQAGKTRLLSPHTRMLVHFGMANISSKGDCGKDELLRYGAEIARLDEILLDILCIRGKLSRQKMRAHLQSNTYIGAEQAIEMGFADDLTYTPSYKK